MTDEVPISPPGAPAEPSASYSFTMRHAPSLARRTR
jgi:hypothetical protein